MAVRRSFVCALLAAVLTGVAAKSDFPKFVKICNRKADLSKCLIENIELSKPYLAKGIPKLYVPSLEPLVVPEVSLKQDRLRIVSKNYTVYGMSTFDVERINVQLNEDVKFEMVVNFPSLSGTSRYYVEGDVLFLKVNGSGTAEGNMTNLVTTIQMNGGYRDIEGKRYIDFNETKISLDFRGDVRLYFHNLFENREDLTKSTNEVLNENAKDVVAELKPVIEDVIASFTEGTVKKLFDKFTLDDLFPL